MNSAEQVVLGLDQVARIGVDHLWAASVAFTATALLVLLLRAAVRCVFGAVLAFQLWLLPLLALLASQLPHGEQVEVVRNLPMRDAIAAVATLPPQANESLGAYWVSAVLVSWVLGVIATAVHGLLVQYRYRLRLHDAVLVADARLRWPVWRAPNNDIGPALVGAWRARIVVPADFETRYELNEQALILLHEATHAARRDGALCLLAQVTVTIIWFNPLAWLALRAFRHDQELACDALVLASSPTQRRAYANAMLKTQTDSLPLLVGCGWPSRHPLTERIAMLKQVSPKPLTRCLGVFAGFALMIVASGMVYAATSPASTTMVVEQEYQLAMHGDFRILDSHRTREGKVDLALCLKPGETGTVMLHADQLHSWTVHASAHRLAAGDLQLDATVVAPNGESLGTSHVATTLGNVVRLSGGDSARQQTYALDVTPIAGCPARVVEKPVNKFTADMTNVPVREAALDVGAATGFAIANPLALDMRKVSFNFVQMPGSDALLLLASIDGKKAVFAGMQVRFESK